MNIVNNQFIGLFRSMRDGQKQAIKSNAVPSPVLGASMLKDISIGEFEAPQYAGSYLVHGLTASGRVATCSLVQKTKGGRNTFLANGKSLEMRTGIPIPSEAPSRANIKAWLAWVQVVNFYHPAGIPAQVVEQENELSMRFPEQGDQKKIDSFVTKSDQEIDDFLFGSNSNPEEESEESEEVEF